MLKLKLQYSGHLMQKIDLLENILESPLDCKKIKSANPILKEMNPEYSFEGLMLKLKLQYFEKMTHWKRP